jgi:hypothetical protein
VGPRSLEIITQYEQDRCRVRHGTHNNNNDRSIESILFWDNLDTYSTDTRSIWLGNISQKNPSYHQWGRQLNAQASNRAIERDRRLFHNPYLQLENLPCTSNRYGYLYGVKDGTSSSESLVERLQSRPRQIIYWCVARSLSIQCIPYHAASFRSRSAHVLCKLHSRLYDIIASC